MINLFISFFIFTYVPKYVHIDTSTKDIDTTVSTLWFYGKFLALNEKGIPRPKLLTTVFKDVFFFFRGTKIFYKMSALK